MNTPRISNLSLLMAVACVAFALSAAAQRPSADSDQCQPWPTHARG
jgi:hypothetical protein